MNPIDELKGIVANQKTIRISRLAPILKSVETMYIQQGKKMKRQQDALDRLNRKK
ncbi:hypothetical protein [Peribacillus asahii]|uniref:hypothetical protein n=1 Tax=Peribacillus asahii TaxID=228899 RepID=UPI00207AE510|nr:hypothetical protein [Peribacillus asahii]USK68414.1 hypothetical protein LIS76_12365 [Peribacillus asahii]